MLLRQTDCPVSAELQINFWKRILIEDVFKLDRHDYMFWKSFRNEDPDTSLMRFLMASKNGVDEAMDLLNKSLLWRQEKNICNIIRNGCKSHVSV